MKSKSKVLDQFITKCSLTFKAYEHEVIISKNKANLWHFSTSYNSKKYMVYCAPNLSKVQAIIKIAMKKIPKGSRLVVVCHTHTKEEKEKADNAGFCLLDIGTLQRFGNDMLDAKSRMVDAANAA